MSEKSRNRSASPEQVKFALEVTDSVIWAIDLETGQAETLQGDVGSLYNLGREGPELLEDTESFLQTAVHPEDQSTLDRVYEQVLAGESRDFDIEYRSHPDNGEVVWIHSRGQVREDADTRLLTGISRDITDRKRRERRLRRQNERLEEFASLVSHDLRNPLNVAQGRIDLALEDCESDHLETASDALDRSQALIGDLLTLAREGQVVGDVEPVSLPDVVEGCWGTVETGDATLRVETEQSVLADRSRLQQLLENLIRNAIEHGGEDVTVAVGAHSDGFSVGDDGPGIPSDEREKVFEAGHSTTADGTGFGLSIVEEIADAHGWDVTVDESEAGGARFELTGVEVVTPDRADQDSVGT